MNPWTRYLLIYAATAGVMLVLDMLWLAVIARPLYQNGIGHLLAEQPRIGIAASFYLMYAGGLVLFAVVPHPPPDPVWAAVRTGALIGLFAYATYDLTNVATLRGWPLRLSLIDMAWGTFVSAVSVLAGKLAFDRLAS